MDMDFYDKAENAATFIKRLLKEYKNPVIMSSFGKDSMVILSLINKLGLNLPVLFHKEAFFPQKYEFAQMVIQKMHLTVYDYAPQTTAVFNHNGQTDIVNFYQVSLTQRSWLPIGINHPKKDEAFLCGFKDLYKKPLGSFNFPWDLVFTGHKDSDVDPIIGPLPVKQDIRKVDNGPDYSYPLRYFTDKDIWEYTKHYNVPFNSRRYDESDGFQEFEDVTFNNDRIPACVRCMSKSEPSVVKCPLLGYEITNISDQVRSVNIGDVPSYIPLGGR